MHGIQVRGVGTRWPGRKQTHANPGGKELIPPSRNNKTVTEIERLGLRPRCPCPSGRFSRCCSPRPSGASAGHGATSSWMICCGACSPGFLHIVRFETDASAVSSGTSTHALSARGHHELHARVLNHRFTREASHPFIVQMLATCPHNLSKDAIATSAREFYQSVEDGYPLTHSASRFYYAS